MTLLPQERDLNEKAILLIEEKRYDEYLQLIEALLAERPTEARVLLHHGTALSLLGRRAEARKSVIAAVAQAPGDPLILTRAASLLYKLGQFDLSQEYVTRAGRHVTLSEFVLGTDLVHLAGQLAAQQGEHDRARTLLQAAVDVGPTDLGHATYAKDLARFLVARGEVGAAKEVVRKALADHPGDSELRHMQEVEPVSTSRGQGPGSE